MTAPKYKVTTDYTEYKSWPWFQDYQALIKSKREAEHGEVLPVSVGEAFCIWVLDTAEVRDIFYRGFVLHIVADDLETALLGTATRYFLLKNNISDKSSAFLAGCWATLKLILTGELPPPPHEKVREQLLRHSWAFRRD